MAKQKNDEYVEDHDKKVPWGIISLRIFGKYGPKTKKAKLNMYRVLVLAVTYATYLCYHLSRRPITVVKTTLVNCNETEDTSTITTPDVNTITTATSATLYKNVSEKYLNSIYSDEEDEFCESWIKEIDGKTEPEAHALLSSLDTTYLISYAVFMFLAGMIADRLDLRYFLAIGMIGSGLITILFGMGKYWGIHSLYYYNIIQFVCGFFQTTGWPGVVSVVGNWFGHGKKGLIMGLWNTHTSIGNIVGAYIAGAFVDDDWGLSFVVPGLIIVGMGVVVWLFLVAKPEDVQLELESGKGLERQSSKEPDVKERRKSSMASVKDIIVSDEKAIGFFGAFKIPGVIEYSLSLFFAKLVSYTFLYWLPTFIKDTGVGVSSQDAANFSIWFDVGGMIGCILAGFSSDFTGMPASVCSVMLITAIPLLLGYQEYNFDCPFDPSSSTCYGGNVALLLLVGVLVNGPYSLITTAVSADLGTHPCLQGSTKALATVTAIIDGTGSIGAAVGPFLAGVIPGKDTEDQLTNTFYMLIGCQCFSLVLLTRLVIGEMKNKLPCLQKKALSGEGV